MDQRVLLSLVAWPNVPHCFGWLALDRRGQWRMRDEYARANTLPGKVIEHVLLKDYISRNYACDSSGRYFFQNGPQRVFITLDATPWIVHISPSNTSMQLLTQCDTAIEPYGALSDERGNIYIHGLIKQTINENTDNDRFIQKESLSIALLLDHDLGLFTDLAKLHEEACSFRGSWNWNGQELAIEPIHSKDLSTRFRFIKNPSN